MLGKEHPNTFQSINNVGSVRLNQLDYNEAELLYRQALEGRKKVLGLNHSDTLQSVSNLGKVLEKLNRLKEAEDQYGEALDGRVKILGKEHPHTLQSAEDLNSLLKKVHETIDLKKLGYRFFVYAFALTMAKMRLVEQEMVKIVLPSK